MHFFLIDGCKKFDYLYLLECVNNQSFYYKFYQTNNLFDYFVNLIVALGNNQSLTLIDSSTRSGEIDELKEITVNEKTTIDNKRFSSIEDLIFSVLRSTSEVTIFTSGTTGQPKKIIHSISTLTRSVRSADKYKKSVWAFAYNPTHMAGLQVFFQAFVNTNTLVNVFNLQRKEIYKLLIDNDVTHISATPTFYRLLLPIEQCCLLVQRITLGGEKSDAHLYDLIQKIFPNAKINNIYASTEAGSLFSASGEFFKLPGELRNKFKVKDGELLIHQSLLGKSDSLVLIDSYYHSSDIIEWIDEEEGLFKFKCRKNELINIGGYKVNPSEVENLIQSMGGVQQAVVYSKPNSVLGNILCADVKLEQGVLLSELDIKKYLLLKLQEFKIPRRIKFVVDFSLTRTGKIRRL